MRWVLYEFYNFRKMKKEGILDKTDFEMLEDDIIYVLHKVIVKDDVLKTLLILSRLLNNKTDKSIRNKYRYIRKH
jgi:hypothetical protein